MSDTAMGEQKKTYKIIQWATGKLGVAAVNGIVGRPDLQLVGAWVHTSEKDGRDVGELCGLPPLGIRATRNKDALLAQSADCVCYAPGRKQSAEETVAEIARILRTGKNVVNSHTPALVFTPGFNRGFYDQLQDACLAGNSSFYTGGIDPGWGTLGLAISALTLSSSVRHIRMYEIANYASWNYPHMISVLGFGQPDLKKSFLTVPGFLANAWGSTLNAIALAMGVQIDNIAEECQPIYAKEAFDIAAAHIPAGSVSGVRYQIKGMINGEARIVVDHITKLRDQDFREVPFEGNGYRLKIEGEPNFQIDLKLSPHDRNPAAVEHAGYIAGAMTLVNAIPAVCDAPPGVLSYLDLRPHPSRNLSTN